MLIGRAVLFKFRGYTCESLYRCPSCRDAWPCWLTRFGRRAKIIDQDPDVIVEVLDCFDRCRVGRVK